VREDFQLEKRFVREENLVDIRKLDISVVETGLDRVRRKLTNGVFGPSESLLFDAKHRMPVFEYDRTWVVPPKIPDGWFERQRVAIVCHRRLFLLSAIRYLILQLFALL
jgi:hypothetical protein